MECIKAALLIAVNFLSENFGAITGICALFVAAYSSYLHRRHFRLSLKPFLSVDYFFDYEENEEGYTKYYQLKTSLINAGLGPAIIESMKISYNDDAWEIKARDFNKYLEKYLSRWNADHPDDFFFFINKGGVVAAGQTVELFRLSFYYDDETVHELDKLLENIKISVSYKSIYGNVYKFSESIINH